MRGPPRSGLQSQEGPTYPELKVTCAHLTTSIHLSHVQLLWDGRSQTTEADLLTTVGQPSASLVWTWGGFGHVGVFLLEAGGSVKQKPPGVIGAHTTGAGIHVRLLFVRWLWPELRSGAELFISRILMTLKTFLLLGSIFILNFQIRNGQLMFSFVTSKSSLGTLKREA